MTYRRSVPNFKILTLGCKVNQYESQQIREAYLRQGFQELFDGRPADTYIINTCTVTHHADRASFVLIRRAKRENPQAKIYVTGCLVKMDAAKIKERFPDVSFLDKDEFKQGINAFCGHTRAFLKIQDGCDNFCSYCKVALVRGKPRSRPFDEVIHEAQRLVDAGFKEIVLCGICLGSYGKDFGNVDLVDVLAALEKIKGEFRIRLSSIEFGDVRERLIKKLETSKKLCPHLHIPLQSGDDRILKLMNRKYTAEDYLKLVQELKRRIPLLSITTDVMVGFPGESE
ncbi:MAG: radical SAM protein, partial [Candidatus Omnitrophica bacterium]|nr:radical SAM protein [Candidatus Omnitrophota bacterium]